MTPFELKLCVHAHNEVQIDNRQRDLWTAWHTAYLHRVEKFPHLTELTAKLLPPSKQSNTEPERSSVSRDLMNALLKLPATSQKSTSEAMPNTEATSTPLGVAETSLSVSPDPVDPKESAYD